MRKTINQTFSYLLLGLLFCGMCLPVYAQELNGQWKTDFRGISVYLEIDNEDILLTIPLQGLADSPADQVEIEEDRLDFYFRKLGASFFGRYNTDSLVGTWRQSGQDFPMAFTRSNDDIDLKRPQEPKAPFPYRSQDVVFESLQDGIQMAGTLTSPEGDGPFPAIVLVSGSGPQTRNSDIFKHKPFLVLADYFTKKGYIVLRYDDRGVNESKGRFKGATSEDFSYDAEGAVQYLSTLDVVDKDRIGILGHSEGGMIAPMVAARENELDFIVLMAGPGTPIEELMKYQLKQQYRKLDFSPQSLEKADVFVNQFLSLVKQDVPNDKIVDELRSITGAFYLGLDPKEQSQLAKNENLFYFSLAPSFLDPWMRSFLRYNPSKTLEKVKIPVLAINGTKDVQVKAKENIKAIKRALKKGGNKQVKTKCFKGKNHLFQTAETGEGEEYPLIEETFSVEVMDYIYEWMEKTMK